MTKKPQTFKYISRCIDKDGVHHLDAIDSFGRHWYAAMQQKETAWLTYIEDWELKIY
tara:strand:+ start:924 stop:1094 length:171 start_codon:yes stop_codon:yes gene_type:complete